MVQFYYMFCFIVIVSLYHIHSIQYNILYSFFHFHFPICTNAFLIVPTDSIYSDFYFSQLSRFLNILKI